MNDPNRPQEPWQRPPEGQQPYGGQQYPGAPQQPWQQGQPPKKRKVWPWVLLGCGGAALIVLLLMVGCGVALFSGEPEEGAGQSGGGSAEESQNSVAVGEPGNVSQWQVTVNGVGSAATYDDGLSVQQPQGEFRVVDLTVENTGQESTTFDSTAVSLVDTEGNTHSASFSGDMFLEQINPGNQLNGTAAFDVPEGTEVESVQIEDTSSFEGPLVVRVE
ncbi:DUF4352 domain-containing protein [Nocardiopsis algeriensis]|uniref:DUF4352 domain-containing protein n=1 Tax=Nocardiopsis algeriensis TaxID=1478215 RepID=UPI003B43A5A6